MKKKFHIKKGDTVKVIAGNHKNSEPAKVLEILGDKERALIEGVNIIKRHTKPSAQFPEGGIVEKEGSIHISNLMLIDPKTGEPTRVGRVRGEDGKMQRVSKKSKEVIE
jgi:large subunit ribosomal protein L24